MCSLVGVVLIARPTFIFGQDLAEGSSPAPGNGPEVTPQERVLAVGMCLVTVIGMTGACTSFHPLSSLLKQLISNTTLI